MKSKIRYGFLVYCIRILDIAIYFGLLIHIINVINFKYIMIIIIGLIIFGYIQFFVLYVYSEKALLRFNNSKSLQNYYQVKLEKNIEFALKRYKYTPFKKTINKIKDTGFIEVMNGVYEKTFPLKILIFFFFARPLYKKTKIRIYVEYHDDFALDSTFTNILLTKKSAELVNSNFDITVLFDEQNQLYEWCVNINSRSSNDDLFVWYYRTKYREYEIFPYPNVRWSIRIITSILGSMIINP